VNFGVVDNLGTALGTIGTGTALNGNVGFTPDKLLTTTGTLAQATTTDPLGFTSATNGAKFGFVANNVTGFIQALETIGSTKILASPRILVLNKQRAEIQLGSRLGFQTLSQNFTSTIQQVQFLNVGTLLRLRPFVSDDGMVRMEIHPERSSGEVNNNIPNQQTAELTTNVMVPDGATLVIGGLMEDQDDFQLQGLPGLARLPALGYLFGYRQRNQGRRELVVLLTPHIWSPELEMAHAPTPHAGLGPTGGAVSRPIGSPFLEVSPGVADPASRTPASGANSEAAAETIRTSATPRTDSRTVVSSAPAAALPPAADPHVNSERHHRLWPPLHQWLSRRSPERKPRSETRAAGMQPHGAASDPGGPNGRDRRQDGQVPTDPAPLSSPQDQIPSPEDGPALSPATSTPLGAATQVRAARSDPMVSLARWDLEPTPHRAADRRPFRDRDESVPAQRAQSPGFRSGPIPSGTSLHTVAPGESFASIAWLYYGSEEYGRALWQVNCGRIARPDLLKAGDRIVVPPRAELNPARQGRERSSSTTPPYTQPADHPAVGSSRKASRPRSRVYVVRPYETLLSIARDQLGDARRADEIRRLNPDRLDGDESLKPGLSLRLPDDARPQLSLPRCSTPFRADERRDHDQADDGPAANQSG
jgi:hypothetical protein